MRAARARGDVLDHVLLYGPPGLGKTSTALILANEMHSRCHIAAAPLLESKADLLALLLALKRADVLFVDEIHRLPAALCEMLYGALEDFRLDLPLSRGVASHDLPRFTFVGATTRPGLIPAPLRARFGIVHRLDFYSADDLAKIITRSAALLGCLIDVEGAAEIARRSRGTPRIANRLLRRVRDYAEVNGTGRITRSIAVDALGLLGIDARGLDDLDRRILQTLARARAPLGLGTLAASLSEEPDTLEEQHEPYLMVSGLVIRTPRGRTITPDAFAILGMKQPEMRASLLN